MAEDIYGNGGCCCGAVILCLLVAVGEPLQSLILKLFGIHIAISDIVILLIILIFVIVILVALKG